MKNGTKYRRYWPSLTSRHSQFPKSKRSSETRTTCRTIEASLSFSRAKRPMGSSSSLTVNLTYNTECNRTRAQVGNHLLKEFGRLFRTGRIIDTVPRKTRRSKLSSIKDRQRTRLCSRYANCWWARMEVRKWEKLHPLSNKVVTASSIWIAKLPLSKTWTSRKSARITWSASLSCIVTKSRTTACAAPRCRAATFRSFPSTTSTRSWNPTQCSTNSSRITRWRSRPRSWVTFRCCRRRSTGSLSTLRRSRRWVRRLLPSSSRSRTKWSKQRRQVAKARARPVQTCRR